VTTSIGITTDLTGIMDNAKHEITGTWQNVTDTGNFLMLKRPTAGSTNFSIVDLAGTWNFTYYYAGSDTPYSGYVNFDSSGVLTSGYLTTEGRTLSSGGATFYDFDNGRIYISVYYEVLAVGYVLQIDAIMDSEKVTVTGTWESWSGDWGTFTASKPLPADGGGGGGG
jgi:hypothetical protein